MADLRVCNRQRNGRPPDRMADDTRDYLRSGGPGQSDRGSMVRNGVPSTQPIRHEDVGELVITTHMFPSSTTSGFIYFSSHWLAAASCCAASPVKVTGPSAWEAS